MSITLLRDQAWCAKMTHSAIKTRVNEISTKATKIGKIKTGLTTIRFDLLITTTNTRTTMTKEEITRGTTTETGQARITVMGRRSLDPRETTTNLSPILSKPYSKISSRRRVSAQRPTAAALAWAPWTKQILCPPQIPRAWHWRLLCLSGYRLRHERPDPYRLGWHEATW